MNKTLLIIFAKAPHGENVKTRLKGRLTLKERQQLQRAFVLDTLSRTADLSVKRVLAGTPKITNPFFRHCQKQYGVDLIPQEGSHLGERMQNAFQWGFERGFQEIVLIGTDAPTLPRTFLSKAFRALRRVPVVLGPAMDGGYYLMGLRSPSRSNPHEASLCLDLFKGIRWGSRTVLINTIKRLHRYHLLPFWYDVDRPLDLDFLAVHLQSLRQQGSVPRETWKRIKRK